MFIVIVYPVERT